MTRTSEWVSLGHPDKMADYISSYLLDRYIERDPLVRFAVEVMIKGNLVFLAGEVTSTYAPEPDQLCEYVREAIREIGYTKEYAQRWGEDETINPETVNTIIKISQQSPDISAGVDNNDGWGDQGIFWGMATRNASTKHLPPDIYYARLIGKSLFDHAEQLRIGLDIKTQITTIGPTITSIIIAAPMKGSPSEIHDIRQNIIKHIHSLIGWRHDATNIIINGTGTFTQHGPVADAGVTGRKLVVDFYGGNCRIGGGSPWTKDPTKADLTLNLYARKLAKEKLAKTCDDTIYVSIACVIGSTHIDIRYYDQEGNEFSDIRAASPCHAIIEMLNLRQPTYAKRCREGLFFDI